MSSPTTETGVTRAAELFKALSAPSRVAILRLLDTPHTVTALAEATGLTQPLVSQHLRVLRQAHLVTVERAGREAIYEVADRHISHIVEDAITHVLETH